MSPMGSILFTILFSTWMAYTAADYLPNEHQMFILDGVTSVLRTCTPATMSLFNEKPFPILTGDNGGIIRPHVAAVSWGDGRIVAYSHTSFYINDLPNGSDSDNVKLVINSINWVRQNAGSKIGVFAEKQLENVLLEHNFEVHVLSSKDLQNVTILEQFDVLAITMNNPGLMNIRTFVQNGGGLLIGATGWNTKPDEIESFWGNVLLQDTGIFYIRYYSYGSEVCDGKCFDTSMELLECTNAFEVWKDVQQFNWNEWNPSMTRQRLVQTMEIILDRFRYGPRNETINDEASVVAHRILLQIPAIIPTATAPVTQENEKNYILGHKYSIIFLNLLGMTDNIPPHPAAASFPGTATLKKFFFKYPNMQRLQETVEIDGSIDWHSTGLYARPGEEIKIQALNTDIFMSDIEVQIGVHTDNLEKLNEWRRCPNIVFRNKMVNYTTTIANPFGGPIIISSSERRNDSLKFTVEGGIRSPTYFLGKTGTAEWQEKIRNYPAPWGELVGEKLIISAQSSLLSELDDPEEVINLWDVIMDTIADLAVISHERDKPSRFVADVQIGGGWMHSGYPIMYYLESQAHPIDLLEIKKDPWILWGFLHELGHNHQKQDWNFKGTGEVTNNLFALYVLHTIFDCPTNSTSSYSDAKKAQRLKTYVENGKQFSQWQSNYDLAFDTYVQLQEAYGWSAYKKIFANYQALSADERPTNDDERIDLWMVMFSRAVEENLADFFISWGFPISSEAVDLVRDLPPTSLRIPELTKANILC